AIFPVWGIDRDRCGCRAFDCTSPGKHPVASCAPHGFKEATTDEATIRAWWTRFPNANIATPTGVWCDVVDVDPRNGGDTTLLELERQHGRLPDTAEVLTGGGGSAHLLRTHRRAPRQECRGWHRHQSCRWICPASSVASYQRGHLRRRSRAPAL